MLSQGQDGLEASGAERPQKAGRVLTSELIRSIPYFAGLEQANLSLQVLAAGSHEEHYRRGQVLFLEGEPCRGLYYLVEGSIRLFKSAPDGKEQNLRLVRPGTTFNDTPVLDGGPNPGSADALESSLIWRVPPEALLKLLEQEPAIARAIIARLSAEVRHLTALLGDISLSQVTARIAKLLLSQVDQTAVAGIGISNFVSAQMTQQQIASTAGTVREMVGRALRAMQQAGAIEARRGYIIVKNPAILQQFL